MFISFKPWS